MNSIYPPLLTLFTAPKPFTDTHINTIQRNAIQSWTWLGEQVEVLLVGNEPGISAVASEFGIPHLPEVRRNNLGTPLVNSIFESARGFSHAAILAYVNADILLLPDFVKTIQRLSEQVTEFLLIGQRWDLDLKERIDFTPGWDDRLRQQTHQQGQLHAPAGSDYFVFPRHLFTVMPDFAIGRAGWDNWMIYHARQLKCPVIDASHDLLVVHQNHDYRHLPGGRPHNEQDETFRNQELAGGESHIYTILDCNRQLVDGKIYPAQLDRVRLVRRMETLLYPAKGDLVGWRRTLIRRLRRLRREFSENG